MTIDKELMQNMEQLSECIDKCEGSVVLKSDDGQNIELKSRLGMCVAACIIMSHNAEDNIEIEVAEEKDLNRIMECIASMNRRVKFGMLDRKDQV